VQAYIRRMRGEQQNPRIWQGLHASPPGSTLPGSSNAYFFGDSRPTVADFDIADVLFQRQSLLRTELEDPPPYYVREAMVGRAQETSFRNFARATAWALCEMATVELIGQWHAGSACLILEVLTVLLNSRCGKSHALSAVLLGLCCPLIFRLGGLDICRAIWIATGDQTHLATRGASPDLLPYVRSPQFVRTLKIRATIPFVTVGLAAPAVHAWIGRWVPNFYLRLTLLLLMELPTIFSALLLVTRILWFLTRPYTSRITRRFLKSIRTATLLCFNATDTVTWWLALLRSWAQLARKPKYQYQDLDLRRKNIRVLEIQPQGRPALRCRLIPISLDRSSKDTTFDAVSYRWGAGRLIYPIDIDGQRFMVNKTVFKLLHYLRLSSQPTKIWIDSICINQQGRRIDSRQGSENVIDFSEKNNQILLMGDIYRRARRVIAWFGDTYEGTGAITHFQRMATTHPLAEAQLQSIATGFFPCGLYKWQKINEFFRNEYFSRIWMVQEIVLARRIVIKHRREEVDWDLFQQQLDVLTSPAGERFLHEPGVLMDWYVDPVVLAGVKNATTIKLVRDMMSTDLRRGAASLHDMTPDERVWLGLMSQPRDSDGLRRLPLHRLLGLSVGFRATNPKDRIYGMLGMAQPASRTLVKPEYDETKASVADVIFNAARSLLLAHDEPLDHLHLAGWGYRNVEILYRGTNLLSRIYGFRSRRGLLTGAAPTADLLNLPSWVPEWHLDRLDKPAVEGPIYAAGRPDTHAKDVRALEPENTTAHKYYIRLRASAIGRVLHLGIFNPFFADGAREPMAAHLRAFLADANALLAARKQGSGGGRGESFLSVADDEILWRTIFGGFVSGISANMATAADFRHLRDGLYLLADLKPPPATWGRDAGSGLGGPQWAGIGNRQHSEQRALYNIGRMLCGHRLAVLDGGTLAVVPPGAMDGDEVVIVWGASMPSVVRRMEKHEEITGTKIDGSGVPNAHVFIGSCYVHGFMSGEGLEESIYPSKMMVFR